MQKVKIEVYEDGKPSVTISVPGWVISGAANLLPKVAGQRLEERVDLRELKEMLKNPQASGTLIEVEDHNAGDRIVISVIGAEKK